MKKQLLLFIPAIFVFALLYFGYSTPKGDTIESRESLLDAVISNSDGWTIAKEIEVDGYIISAAYSTDHKSTLAILNQLEMERINLKLQPIETAKKSLSEALP